jgi:hypothetical protein
VPDLPSHVTVEEIESHLDRVALEIDAIPNGEVLLPLFEWLQGQLERKKAQEMTMDAVRQRLRRLRA